MILLESSFYSCSIQPITATNGQFGSTSNKFCNHFSGLFELASGTRGEKWVPVLRNWILLYRRQPS